MAILVWILGDQLLKAHPALLKAAEIAPKKDLHVVLIESQAQLNRYRYHIKKLTFLISAMRHYAKELRAIGYQVRIVQALDTLTGLKQFSLDHKISRVFTMAASSKRGQTFQEQLSSELSLPVTILPNTQFLCGQFDPFPDVQPNQIIRQETFYRSMRGHFGLLMEENGQPVNGQWNLDAKNRQPLPRDHQPPVVLGFEPDQLTQQVMQEVRTNYQTIGCPEGFTLATTRAQANLAAEDFFNHRLIHFGTYEDAMHSEYQMLYHSKLSPYTNVGLLEPLELAKRAENAYRDGEAALNNVEGFIRQVVGWREYMYWQYQRLPPKLLQEPFTNKSNPLPKFFWDGKTKMNCLKHVIDRVLEFGYCHHIERLMILTNFCLLAEINAEEVFDWFMSTFVDAYEWVMVPNVYGMGLYAGDGQIATKPYISSANYINKMSNYCKYCAYDKNSRAESNACPFNFLYWHFLIKNEVLLRKNHRMARMLYHLQNFSEKEKKEIKKRVVDFFNNPQS